MKLGGFGEKRTPILTYIIKTPGMMPQVARKGIIDDMSNDMNENAGLINYIMLGRIYDLLILLCDAQGKGEDALKIMELHRQGHLMSPLPSLVGDISNQDVAN
jgi:hypothetical protein